MTLAPYLSSHSIQSTGAFPFVLCYARMDLSQDLANYPVGYTSYIETLKLTSQLAHTHTPYLDTYLPLLWNQSLCFQSLKTPIICVFFHVIPGLE